MTIGRRLARAFAPIGLLAFGALGGTACKQDAPACTPPQNPTCPATVPSFSNEVYPNIIEPYCSSACHNSTSGVTGTILTTYQQVYGPNGQEATEIFNQTYESCLMPPAGSPQLTDAVGRQTLLDWLACNAPDN